ncbi:hypothetical protein AG1IA_09939 [Rhizoctonia solani AG-1 IA]|uniref:Uncharacterized protein n=1 Tax=Thanatephorus cucumeris (strain AG1-IA) TaxID=983506 RepID=L8WGX5_THACA|nr:hypothetical protein AG1IA_09939 [Rhizoctonia solani AG-1 IA]
MRPVLSFLSPFMINLDLLIDLGTVRPSASSHRARVHTHGYIGMLVFVLCAEMVCVPVSRSYITMCVACFLADG